MLKRSTLLAAVLSANALFAQAETPEQAITESFRSLDSRMTLKSIMPTEMKGLYEVILPDNTILYSDESGKYLLQGHLLKLENGSLTSLTEQTRGKANKQLLSGLKTEDMIVYPAEGETKASIYIFTDVDCGYCRKLQKEVPALNKASIEVRYLAFPRGGVQSATSDKMAQAWCATDRIEALTNLKNGKAMTSKVAGNLNACKKTVNDQYLLGQQLGLSGTPAIVLENGTMIPGYRPAAALIDIILPKK